RRETSTRLLRTRCSSSSSSWSGVRAAPPSSPRTTNDWRSGWTASCGSTRASSRKTLFGGGDCRAHGGFVHRYLDHLAVHRQRCGIAVDLDFAELAHVDDLVLAIDRHAP